ncbi:hypothetical protein PDIG_26110 [Penicillium digitatum PHI26]|uniref:Uncharacterized protein n=2 Tax=Penicillium digitatum TaxID=36651 RepID=K9G0K1_PEND2|nr:hypothetical protein PDIP_60590 [Penicillium digitatum Pd1]EKV10343.1 hypothetical protein PDIP_60590 [Penicillium digitatum Pd1]EKV15490.1 hypothetical protein PDIG_26110 [Penicillium digitatum PHI26]
MFKHLPLQSSTGAHQPHDQWTSSFRGAKHLERNSHLFVIIYGKHEFGALVPLGTLLLESSPRDMVHHQCSTLGISISKEYQNY